MSIWAYQSKNTSTFTNQTKNIASWDYEVLSGGTYLMGYLNMGSEFDKSGSPVYLGQIGTGQSYTYQTKN